jgi:LPXTG-site transpeptidase (sortase) family protein
MTFRKLRLYFVVLGVLMLSLFMTSGLDAGARPRISIGAINVSKRIVELPLTSDSWDIKPWEKNVGHLAGTAWFDNPGNVVLAGHSTYPNGKPAPFFYLNQVGVGSDIAVFDGSVNRHYTVTDVRTVSEWDLSVTDPTPDDRLTLITCDVGSYNAETQSYDNRLVVIAQRAS